MRFRLVLAAFLSAASLIWGQIGGGSIVGTISDSTGASAPQVTVSARNLDTNVVQQTTTNTQGYYEFPLLPAGRYQLSAEAAGFQKTLSQPFILNTGSRPRIDIQLQLGAVNQSVEVTATARARRPGRAY